MRYLCIHKSSRPEGELPGEEEMTAMGGLIEEGMKSGILLATEGCLPSAKGFRIRNQDGEYTFTDGPFTETKEIIGGFALIEVPTKEDAIAFTKRFLEIAGNGETEIRLLCGPPGTAG